MIIDSIKWENETEASPKEHLGEHFRIKFFFLGFPGGTQEGNTFSVP